MVQEETRKGPWTEQEDLQLVYFVSLFGERRWDFIAKVSGLNRTGKSCRLRWVNYLHPGLKRGRMTPQEERLVLELHSRWGNRWSRIARKLPGRTDNEIKNYWRTHMRKKAQEKKRALLSSSSSSTSISSSLSLPDNPGVNFSPKSKSEEGSLHDKGSCSRDLDLVVKAAGEVSREEGYSMDQIWEEIASSEEVSSIQGYYKSFSPPMIWDYCSDSLWRSNEEDMKMLLLMGGGDLVISNYGHGRGS
ncbi:hypothetical protein GIB67_015069 [Kingdonia uniflora]|uniref:Uncharacterized protein n=1 Tax=Kingdonia uniflora TaxID=39325 RepID=A0A7J7NNJ9_9MAGN|nr:hypothetical protein GIB67_015069 [Kingdonia uniflora]